MVKRRIPKSPAPGDRPKFFSKLLKGTFDHFSAELTGKFSFWWRWILAFLFRKVELSDADAQKIANLSRRGAIIYITRNRSRLEYLMLAYLFAKKGLPAPKFSHYVSMYNYQTIGQTVRRFFSRLATILERRAYPNPYTGGYVEKLFLSGDASLLPARHFTGLPWRFGRRKPDPLSHIIRIQRQIEKPIYLLPLEIAYGQRPDREFVGISDLFLGTTVNPSRLRQLIMALRFRKNTTILVSDPMSLEQEVEEAMIHTPKTPQLDLELAYTIRTKCIQKINRERRVILGPVMKTRSEVIEDILHDRELFKFLQDLSKADQKDFVQLRRDARKMLEEIASDYNPRTVRFMTWFLRYAFKKLYAGMEVNLDQLNRVRELAREMPVVYVPCHKSHLDYLIVSFLLYEHKMMLPHIVSGVNLNFWPVGGIFRGGGAFFMRRTFRGKRLYSKVFSKYVEYLVKNDIPIEFFIEGTRSRTGKIVLPKLGFLSILLNAVKGSGKKNLCIVPISINYEHLFEKNFYLNEAKGKKNEGENVRTMLRHGKMVKQKLGRMYLEIAEPFTLSDLIWQKGGRFPNQQDAFMELAGQMAYRVAHSINVQSIATPYAIVAATLLANAKLGIKLSELKRGSALLLGHLRGAGVRVVGVGPTWVESVIQWLLKEKILVEDVDDDTDDEIADSETRERFFFIDEDSRIGLTIYKNNIVHHYSFQALLSCCFLAAGEPITREALFEQFCWLKSLMSGELIYSDKLDSGKEFDHSSFNEAMEFFSGHGFLRSGEGGLISLIKPGRKAAGIFSGSILDFLTSYFITARTLQKLRSKELSDKEWVKRVLKQGKRDLSTEKIRRAEGIHKNIIEGGLHHMKQIGILETTDSKEEKYKRSMSYRVRDLTELQKLVDRLKPFMEL